jgi:hypothetical protein
MDPPKTEIELDLEKVEEAGSRTHALELPAHRLSDGIEAVLGASALG